MIPVQHLPQRDLLHGRSHRVCDSAVRLGEHRLDVVTHRTELRWIRMNPDHMLKALRFKRSVNIPESYFLGALLQVGAADAPHDRDDSSPLQRIQYAASSSLVTFPADSNSAIKMSVCMAMEHFVFNLIIHYLIPYYIVYYF